MADRRQLLPWPKVGSMETLASRFGKWLGLQRFRNPKTGTEEEYIFIGQKDWSVVLAISPSGKVRVGRQFKHGVSLVDDPSLNGGVIDELPAGTALNTKNEDPAGIMKERLEAETGYKAKELVALTPQFIATRSSPTRFHPFVAFGCRKIRGQKHEVNEDIDAYSVDLEVWLGLVFSGKIVEPSAICATTLALPHLRARGYMEGKMFDRVCQRIVPLAA